MADILVEFRRYESVITAAIAPAPTAFAPEAENAVAVQVERGSVFAHALLMPAYASSAVERLIELSTSPRLAAISIVDRSGHHRPVYRALMVYSWLRAFSLWYETLPRSEFGRWEEALRPWCDLLESELGQIEFPAGNAPMPAGRGSSATEAAWIALALHVAGKLFIRDAWTDLAADAIGKITRRQQANGPFLLAGASDNPETHWYHELVVLHAVASYAVQTEDRNASAAVAKATVYHLNETQPDHASSQPWALFAFIWNHATRPLADQLLHAATVLSPSPGTPGEGRGEGRAATVPEKDPHPNPLPEYRKTEQTQSGVSLMLLADCLYCLRLFTGPRQP